MGREVLRDSSGIDWGSIEYIFISTKHPELIDVIEQIPDSLKANLTLFDLVGFYRRVTFRFGGKVCRILFNRNGLR